MNNYEKINRIFSKHKSTLQYEFEYKEAAVLIPLVETAEGISILFEVRSSDLIWQPGEICFPGGKKDGLDIDFKATAIRETCEELQLEKSDIDVYGQVDYFCTQLGLIIYPYVGKISDINKVRPNNDEVEKVFTVPLEKFLKMVPQEMEIESITRACEGNHPHKFVEEYYKNPQRVRTYKIYFYEYKDYLIWGITARILNHFLNLYKTC